MTPLPPDGLVGAANGAVLSGWEKAAISFVGAIVVVEVAYRILRVIARRLPSERRQVRVLVTILANSKLSVMALAVSIVGVESVRLAPTSMHGGLSEIARVALVLSITAIAVSAVRILHGLARLRFDTSVADNRDARRAVTQLGLVRRVLTVAIVVIGGLAALTSLPEVRTVGASLLASAGVLGIVAGIAGQSTLGNVIAGLQVAFSDVLRLDDVVVVQGAWGTIEQISLTYVVVKVWDERRLVLPVSYFVANPFENWTRTGAQILGTIYLYVDFTVPVDEIRREVVRFVAEHPLWDGRVAGLVLVDVTESAVKLRALVSSATSGDNWNLRCDVREHLVEYVRVHHPDTLPRLRLTMSPPPSDVSMNSRPA